MSEQMRVLVMQLAGPIQSWGYDSRYIMRNTGMFPSKSAVFGICCAARGIPRGSEEETAFLEILGRCRMMSIAIPRSISIGNTNVSLSIRRISDFQTIMGTSSADGKLKKNAVLTHRQYLCDADFLVALEGPAPFIGDLGEAIKNPRWGVWLGRKSCPPTRPLFAGICTDQAEFNERFLDNQQIDAYAHMTDAPDFKEGTDSIPDVPENFDCSRRSYRLRRVKIRS